MEYKWEREKVEKLITLVEQNPCLYYVKSADYRDRLKKSLAFNSIWEQMKDEINELKVEDLQNKWRNIRNQYMRELRLINNSRKSGSSRNELLKPKLWCFHQLAFLETHILSRESEDNIETVDITATTNTKKTSSVNLDSVPKPPKKMDITTLQNTDSSSSSGCLEPIAKRTKKPNPLSEMQRNLMKFQERIQERKTAKKYKWLGDLIATRMEEITPEQQDKAAGELQSVLQKHIDSSRSNTPSTSSSSSNKDLLQICINEIFDESDFDM